MGGVKMERIVKTFCGVCERTCGMQVTVKDNKVQKLEGLKEHLRSRGDLCVKGKAALDIMYAPDRLRYPLKKKNGKWEQLSWDEALDLIVRKLDEIKKSHGASNLAVYHGQTYLKNCIAMFCMKRFLNVYGTVNLCSAASECFIPHLLNGMATFGSLAFADVENSKCIIIWGSNPFASGSLVGCSMPRTIRIFTELKKKGVEFIVIDPRNPTISKLADIHLRVRPGTDGALALGMIKVIIDKELYDKEYVGKYTSGFDKLKEMVKEYDLEKVEKITLVPRTEIEKAARTFATIKPASVIPGVGVEHQTNTVQTLRAISILLAITGNIDIKGGNTFISTSFLAPADVEGVPKPSGSPIGMEEHPMFVSMINQAHALVVIEKILEKEDSPIKALIVAGGAPIPQLANTNKVKVALKKLDFIAVIDLFMTETARHADLVIPASFFLERDEIATMPLNLQKKAVDDRQCWPDWKFWWELAKKMGYERHFPWKNFEELIDFVLKPTGVTYEELKKHPEGIMDKIPPGKFLKDGFYTYSGKIEIYSKSLESNGYAPLPVYKEPMESIVSTSKLAQEYPLTMITGGRQPMYLHSQHRNIAVLRKLLPEPYLEIHPKTAKDCGVGDGDYVVVESKRGKIKIRAKLEGGIMSQVIHIPHGWSEADCNILTDHENRDPISGFPGLKSSLCRIKKI
jgi:anaerobic selenocysteine-containing dehydrogenase